MSQITGVTLVSPKRLRADLVVVGCFEGEKPELEDFPKAVQKAAAEAAGRSGWRGVEEQISEVASKGDGPIVSLRGLGGRDGFDLPKLRGWLSRAARHAQVNEAGRVAFALPEHPETGGAAAAERITRDLFLSGYRFDRFRDAAKRPRTKAIQLVPPRGEEASYRRGLRQARAVAAGVELTRDLGNTPPNEATPRWMASQARRLAREHGMKVRVLGPRELERMGMGGILAVGGGSANPPCLVRLEWGLGKPIVALVGKGVTFDTGGISIKPAAAMDEMKFDKCGACTALGVARAVAELGLRVRLRVYLALAENMPDGTAYRPGDIVRCYNGKTVEIINTDAEGRMILADALSWAVEEKPDWLLEYSTLTGASVVALGRTTAGLYTPDGSLAAALLRGAQEAGERLWRMPLWPEFVEEMKGNHADLKNTGGRWGGANTAAAFLSQFVGSIETWAHLDIAGPAYTTAERKKGATGYGVALTLNWLQGLVGRGKGRR